MKFCQKISISSSLFLIFSLSSLAFGSARLIAGSLVAPYGHEIVSPGGLQCEHLVNPIGIDVPKPRLSWLLSDTRQGAKQTA